MALANLSFADLTWKMVLIVFIGVFAGSFMDAIAGGGGLITLPTYLLTGLPAHIALGTNKFSSCIGTSVSAGRYICQGYTDFRIAAPAAVLAVITAHFGTKLQLMVPDVYLRYVLLVVLPVAAFVVLKRHELPEERLAMDRKKRIAIVCLSAAVIGLYDGFYGPGAGTFYLLCFCGLGKLDVRSANGMVKMVNVASNLGALITSVISHQVFFALGLLATAASISGHYIGSGFAIKNGSKIVRPMVIVVLILLAIKIISGFITGNV